MHNNVYIRWKQHSFDLMVGEGETLLLPDNMGGKGIKSLYSPKNNLMRLSHLLHVILWFISTHIYFKSPPGAHLDSI